MRKLLALVAALVMLVMTAGIATAHTPSASLTCVDGTPKLQIDLVSYQPNQTNTVKYSVDGTVILDTTTFSTEYHLAPTSVGSPFVGHTATVIVKAGDDPTGAEGWSKTFELSVLKCQEPPPSVEQSIPASVEQSIPASVEQSIPASVEQSVAASVAQSIPASVEQSVGAGTGTPAASTPNTSTFGEGSSPLPTIIFSLVLLASLGTLAYTNVKVARAPRRNR